MPFFQRKNHENRALSSRATGLRIGAPRKVDQRLCPRRAEHPVGEKEDAGQVYNKTPKLNDIRITSNDCRDTCYVMLFASEG